MSRGEKSEGVRQGRPLRRGVAIPEITREADRIIRERLREKEKEKGGAISPLFAFLCGVITTIVLSTVLQMLLHAM